MCLDRIEENRPGIEHPTHNSRQTSINQLVFASEGAD